MFGHDLDTRFPKTVKLKDIKYKQGKIFFFWKMNFAKKTYALNNVNLN